MNFSDDAAVLLERGPDGVVEAEQPDADVLDVEPLGGRRRADDVGEDRRDLTALLDRDGGRDRGTAVGAEPGGVGCRRAARAAGVGSAAVRRQQQCPPELAAGGGFCSTLLRSSPWGYCAVVRIRSAPPWAVAIRRRSRGGRTIVPPMWK